MRTSAAQKTTVTVFLDRGDVFEMLFKAGMKPETFGKFWSVELESLNDGGLKLTYEQELNVEPVPKLS